MRKLYNTPGQRLKHCHVPPEMIESIKKKYSLNTIFKKYKIPSNRSSEICRLLGIGLWEVGIEEKSIIRKDRYKLSEKINLPRLGKDVHNLLDSTPYFTKKEKDECESIINFAITYEGGRRLPPNDIKKNTQKRTVAKIKKNPRELRIFTLLIKELANTLNPVFFHRKKFGDRDYLMPQARRKEQTFEVVAKLLNATFPNLKFTPEQVKGRYHKGKKIKAYRG